MRILKYTIPVDGKWHLVPELQGINDIRHIAVQNPDRHDEVQVWFEVDPRSAVRATTPTVELRVYGTGQEIDCGDFECEYVGTGITARGGLVWHVFARDILTIRTVR